MRTIKVLAGALLAACGVAAAVFLGAVSPADAGEQALPVRMADAEQAITIQGEAIESLRQQVITIQGENFGGRMDKLDQAVADLKAELAAARKENSDLRTLLGAEAGRLDSRIDAVQSSLNAKIDAEVAKLDAADASLAQELQALEQEVNEKLGALENRLQGRIDATRTEITARDQILYNLLHAEIEALGEQLDARITAVANAQNGTVNLPPS